MVGVSGSLAQESAKQSSDIDFFIIAASHRIWWVRFWSKLLLKITRLDRSESKTGGHFCYNHYVSTDSLKLDSESEYVARLFSHLVPIYGFAIYRDFCSTNAWIGRFVAQYPIYHFPAFKIAEDHGIGGQAKRVGENLLHGKWGDWCEHSLKQLQLHRILRDNRRLDPGAQVVTTDAVLRFHLEAKEPLVMARYQEKLAEFGLNC
jgi:hypothetical protein